MFFPFLNDKKTDTTQLNISKLEEVKNQVPDNQEKRLINRK